MKIYSFFLIGIIRGQSSVTTDRRLIAFAQEPTRKMRQLRTMFEKRHGLLTFLQAYGYGCYCLNLGETPMSGMVQGIAPKDAKDEVCQKYTQCLKCAKIDHGDNCTPENRAYTYNFDEENIVQCEDPENRCNRKICECDKYVVEAFDFVLDQHNSSYWAFTGFDFDSECQMPAEKIRDPILSAQCCETGTAERIPFMGGPEPQHRTCCSKTGTHIIMSNADCDAI